MPVIAPPLPYVMQQDTSIRAALLDRLSLLLAGGAGELTPARAAALDRLINDLTAARAALLPNLDATVSSRMTSAQQNISAVQGANLDAAVSTRMTPAQQNISAGQAANLDAAVSSRLTTAIRSTQQGSIDVATTVGMTETTNTAAITSVNTAKAYVVLLGVYGPGPTNPIVFGGGCQLTNATTVTAFVSVQTSGAIIRVRFVVVEFN